MVMEDPINNDVVRVLLEAMNYSRVERLEIGYVSKGTVLDYSYPTDRVVDLVDTRHILNFVAVFEIFKFLITNVIRDVTLPHRAPPIL